MEDEWERHRDATRRELEDEIAALKHESLVRSNINQIHNTESSERVQHNADTTETQSDEAQAATTEHECERVTIAQDREDEQQPTRFFPFLQSHYLIPFSFLFSSLYSKFKEKEIEKKKKRRKREKKEK
jgi:hypothetical protein